MFLYMMKIKRPQLISFAVLLLEEVLHYRRDFPNAECFLVETNSCFSRFFKLAKTKWNSCFLRFLSLFRNVTHSKIFSMFSNVTMKWVHLCSCKVTPYATLATTNKRCTNAAPMFHRVIVGSGAFFKPQTENEATILHETPPAFLWHDLFRRFLKIIFHFICWKCKRLRDNSWLGFLCNPRHVWALFVFARNWVRKRLLVCRWGRSI